MNAILTDALYVKICDYMTLCSTKVNWPKKHMWCENQWVLSQHSPVEQNDAIYKNSSPYILHRKDENLTMVPNGMALEAW